MYFTCVKKVLAMKKQCYLDQLIAENSTGVALDLHDFQNTLDTYHHSAKTIARDTLHFIIFVPLGNPEIPLVLGLRDWQALIDENHPVHKEYIKGGGFVLL
jgi:hypothetical protein